MESASGSMTLHGSSNAPADLLRRMRMVNQMLAALPQIPTGPVLLFRLPDQSVEAKPIAQGITVGRSEECDLCFPEVHNLSRRHFEIRPSGDRCLLTDLDSRNGTFIGGTTLRVDTRELRDGDIIEAGGMTFVFVCRD